MIHRFSLKVKEEKSFVASLAAHKQLDSATVKIDVKQGLELERAFRSLIDLVTGTSKEPLARKIGSCSMEACCLALQSALINALHLHKNKHCQMLLVIVCISVLFVRLANRY